MHSLDKVQQSPAYGAIPNYLANDKSLERALDAFCEPVERQYITTQDLDAVEEALWQCWRAVVTTAASVPHISVKRQKLVEFVLELQKRPSPSKDGKACVVQGGEVWKDLPVFGMEMREAWNLAARNESDRQQKDKWINLNAWTATLVSTVQAKGLSTPDFSLYGIWTIRMALEEPDAADVTLEAAAVWLVYSSSCIHQLCRDGKTFEGKVAKPGSEFRDREWRGFTSDRWTAWMEQMKKHCSSASAERTAKLMADAVRAMEAAG